MLGTRRARSKRRPVGHTPDFNPDLRDRLENGLQTTTVQTINFGGRWVALCSLVDCVSKMPAWPSLKPRVAEFLQPFPAALRVCLADYSNPLHGLALIESIARRRGACKLTLEVLQATRAPSGCVDRVDFSNYQLDQLDRLLGNAQFLQK